MYRIGNFRSRARCGVDRWEIFGKHIPFYRLKDTRILMSMLKFGFLVKKNISSIYVLVCCITVDLNQCSDMTIWHWCVSHLGWSSLQSDITPVYQTLCHVLYCPITEILVSRTWQNYLQNIETHFQQNYFVVAIATYEIAPQ